MTTSILTNSNPTPVADSNQQTIFKRNLAACVFSVMAISLSLIVLVAGVCSFALCGVSAPSFIALMISIVVAALLLLVCCACHGKVLLSYKKAVQQQQQQLVHYSSQLDLAMSDITQLEQTLLQTQGLLLQSRETLSVVLDSKEKEETVIQALRTQNTEMSLFMELQQKTFEDMVKNERVRCEELQMKNEELRGGMLKASLQESSLLRMLDEKDLLIQTTDHDVQELKKEILSLQEFITDASSNKGKKHSKCISRIENRLSNMKETVQQIQKIDEGEEMSFLLEGLQNQIKEVSGILEDLKRDDT